MTTKRIWTREYAPGTTAPASGTYEQLNVLGAVTGVRLTIAKGQALPPAPRGFTWSVVEDAADREAAD